MKEITPTDKKNAYVGRNFRKQVSWIYANGCNKIKCPDCCMQKICDHYPANSKVLAYNLLMYAAEKAKVDKDGDK
jgi:hypothetical protein